MARAEIEGRFGQPAHGRVVVGVDDDGAGVEFSSTRSDDVARAGLLRQGRCPDGKRPQGHASYQATSVQCVTPFEGLTVDRRFEGLDDKINRQFTWLVGIQVTTLVAIVGALLARP